MNIELIKALADLETEKGIKKGYMLDKIALALSAAYKAIYKKDPQNGAAENVTVTINEETGQIDMFAVKKVVEIVENPSMEISIEDAHEISEDAQESDEIKIEIDSAKFGRIATQTAKQVIIQGIREAERSMVADEFEAKSQEILTGVVTKIDTRYGNILVEVGGTREKSDGVLIPQEQVKGEVFHEGERIKVFLAEVRRGIKGPQIVISRSHPGLVKRLFELEVPEIADGTVVINSIAREAGSRTKIAVSSIDDNVDPVGACVGPHGNRVSSIVNELRGEKIDIIKYSPDPVQFVAEALSPSDVLAVTLNEDGKSCRVIVPNDQLSLAIGKEGQNARLAAKLTGKKIDIQPEIPVPVQE